MTKRRALYVVIAVVAILLLSVVLLRTRQRLPRHRVFRTTPTRRQPLPAVHGVEQWTAQFRALENHGQWRDLAELLAQIEKTNPAEYQRWSLAYLHARALIESNERRAAAAKLAPFLAPGNPLRDLALFHQSEIDDSSATRQALIFGYPHSLYREQVIEEEQRLPRGAGVVELDSLRDLKSLQAFAARLTPNRDVSARIVEAQLRAGDANGALLRGLSLLKGSTTDDAADRTSRALDRPDFLHRMNGAELTLLGSALFDHRHFDRAVAVLSVAPRSDQNTFDVGRAYFGDEKYGPAQQTYLRGAAATRAPTSPDCRIGIVNRSAPYE